MITGIIGFVVWFYLVRNNPDHAVNIALGVLLILVGFGGRDTVIDIIKSWKQ